MNMFADDELLDSQQDLFPSQASTPFSQRSTQPPSPIIINLCSDIEDDPPSPVFKKRRATGVVVEANDESGYRSKKLVPGYPEWFNLKYTGDLAIYSYKLLEDYKKGDLKLLL